MPSPAGELHASSVIRFHDRQLQARDWPVLCHDGARRGPWEWIAANHRYNGLLWLEEDRARRRDVGPEAIAASKALIDRYNQKRNDAVEVLDEALLASLGGIEPEPGARLSSETAGAMIDRLSILALKIHHMRMQAQRADAGPEHVRTCGARVERLRIQRHDLASCLDALLLDARAGRAYFKVYRQFKMYNDPALNPYLNGQAQRAQQGRAAP